MLLTTNEIYQKMVDSVKIKRGVKDYCTIFVLNSGKIGVAFRGIDKGETWESQEIRKKTVT